MDWFLCDRDLRHERVYTVVNNVIMWNGIDSRAWRGLVFEFDDQSMKASFVLDVDRFYNKKFLREQLVEDIYIERTYKIFTTQLGYSFFEVEVCRSFLSKSAEETVYLT